LTSLTAQDFFSDDLISIESKIPKNVYYGLANFNLASNVKKGLGNKTYKLDSLYGHGSGNVPTGKLEFIFTPEKDISLSFQHDQANNSFEPDFKYVYHYKDGLLSEYTFNAWDGNYNNLDIENPLLIRYYEYNDDNLLVELKVLDQDDLLNGGKGNLSVFNYDENNKPAGRSNYYWNDDTNSYVHSTELIFRNNQDGLLEEIINLKYRPEYGWTQEDSTVYTYNEFNQILIEDKHNKGPLRDTFKHQIQKLYEYNIDGSINKIFEQRAPSNQYPNVWNLNYFHRFNYYAFGSLKSEGLYFVEGPEDTSLDEQQERSDYKYNELITVEDIQFPRTRFTLFSFDDHYFENHMLLEETHFLGGNQFEAEYQTSKKKYFYSKLSTSTTDNISSDLNSNIYPNPSSDFITVEIPAYTDKVTVFITDIHGKKVKNINYQNGQKIPVSDLDNGVYFYIVKVNDQQYGGKFVVAK